MKTAQLATKADLIETREVLRSEMAGMKNELRFEMAALELRLTAKMAALHTRVIIWLIGTGLGIVAVVATVG